eukprot:1214623-Karenia_brevis.AAC.1
MALNSFNRRFRGHALLVSSERCVLKEAHATEMRWVSSASCIPIMAIFLPKHLTECSSGHVSILPPRTEIWLFEAGFRF